MTASSISRQLHRAGFRPVPASSQREGVKVTGKKAIYVRCDFDDPAARRTVSTDIIAALTEIGHTAYRISDAVVRVAA